MSLHTPFFFYKSTDDPNVFHLYHNCNGGIDFMSYECVDEKVTRLIDLAIEEGKRQKASEILMCLGVKK